jgi:general nucleoside transport system ATP-binding protein
MSEIEMRGIVKRFGDVTANAGVNFTVEKGEIRALVGENGAGKTTLMRILFGLYQPDEGEIRLRGRVVKFHGPRDAISLGIGMVHQHFMLFDDLSVTENVVFGMEPRRWGFFVDQKKAEKEVANLAENFGLRVDPQARLGSLSVGERQRVEILKTLYRGANVLILDEPTAVLTPQEGDELFVILRGLAKQGKAIILITHKLPEVMAVTHTATVLRRGKVTGLVKTSESSPRELANLMVGRDVLLEYQRRAQEPGDEVLKVSNLNLADRQARPILSDISFQVRAGEIVGLAGVAGNGQTDLINIIVGLRKPDNGKILISEKDVTGENILKRRQSGLSYIPEDRYLRGLAIEASVAENLSLGFHRTSPIGKRGIIFPQAIQKWSDDLIEEYDIRVGNAQDNASTLSGGNLQKLVVAREFSHDSRLILADQPTRGVDISASEFIHKKLIERRDAGDAVLMVSADLDEIMSLSDRILVISEGRIVADVLAEGADENELGLLMTGGDRAENLISTNEIIAKAETNVD